MIRPGNTDRLLSLAMSSMGGKCSYITNDSRWMNYQYEGLSFSAFSTRFPFDDPRRICEIDNKLYARSILTDGNVPLIPWQLLAPGQTFMLDKGDCESWVAKPIYGSKGSNVVTKLSTEEVLTKCQKSPGIYIVEPFINGKVLRILLLKNQIISAYEKLPPKIIGDGLSTIEQLVQNYVELVETHFQNGLETDLDIKKTIQNSNIDLGAVLYSGEELVISNVSNICRGSTWKMVSLTGLDRRIVDACTEAAKVTKLNLVGIDLLISDSKIYVLETNPSPGIFGHSVRLDSLGSFKHIDLKIIQKILRNVIRHLSPSLMFNSPKDTILPYSMLSD